MAGLFRPFHLETPRRSLLMAGLFHRSHLETPRRSLLMAGLFHRSRLETPRRSWPMAGLFHRSRRVGHTRSLSHKKGSIIRARRTALISFGTSGLS